MNKLTKHFTPKLILLAAVALTILAPHIFTRNFGWSDFANFTQTGQIGDTIGGTTAPIIGLVSAILLYLAFREQRTANEIHREALEAQRKEAQNAFKIQTEALEVQRKEIENNEARKQQDDRVKSIETAYSLLRENIANFGYTNTKDEIYIGEEAIKELLRDLYCQFKKCPEQGSGVTDIYIAKFQHILNLVELIVDYAEMLDDTHKSTWLGIAGFEFNYRVIWHFTDMEISCEDIQHHYCEVCKFHHGFVDNRICEQVLKLRTILPLIQA